MARLEYSDALMVGLAATPSLRTLGLARISQSRPSWWPGKPCSFINMDTVNVHSLSPR
jgi:hypothetical protein